MISQGTFLQVSDNSGARTVYCVKIMSGFQRRYAYKHDVIIVSVKRLRTKRRSSTKVQKGSVLRALIVRTKKEEGSLGGFQSKFYENSVVLLNKQQKPIGTRIFGGVSKSLRYSKYMRLVSLSSGLIK